MTNDMELQQAIYNIFEMQIKFGVHRYGDSLPTIKEAGSYFLASGDTVRLAYLRLKQEGYISLGTCVGAAVKVNYSDEEIRRNVRDYFACRREALLAFTRSMGSLGYYPLCFALMRASPEGLDELERTCLQKQIPPVYRMSRKLQLLYGPLGNDLLLRLFWQMFLFFQAPFVSAPQSTDAIRETESPLLGMIRLARRKDWAGLRLAGEKNVQQYQAALRSFFDESIPPNAGCGQVDFTWSIYKKTSQICYSLCMDILLGIRDGVYPAGSFLPPPQQLAAEKQVSLNTVRRSVLLLNKLGAAKSVNGVGTRVLPPLDSAKNCDFKDAALRRRLVDFLNSFHILALSCRACAGVTVASMDAALLGGWTETLERIRQSGIYEDLIHACFELISAHAPYPAIRTVYAELARQLFWGYPLRDLHGDREQTNAYFLPFLTTLRDHLARGDAEGFSAQLEELLFAETACVAAYLTARGIEEAAAIAIPRKER